MSTISVIVPVYNAQAYLRKCVDSILNQTFTDLEIILVDDFSTDNSWEICSEYEKSDSRVKAIHRSKNDGISAARNDGLDSATGKFVIFVDSDDWLANIMCESLINAQADSGASLVSCGYKEIIGTNAIVHEYENNIIYFKEKIQNELLYKFVGELQTTCAVWARLFEKKILDNYNLRFREMHIKEDFYFMIEYLQCIEKAVYIAGPYYNYLVRSTSAIHSIGSVDKEITVCTPMTIYNIFELRGGVSYRFYKALGMEYITSICRLASCCSKAEFIKYTEQKIFRKHLYLKNMTQLNAKFKILYLLVKFHFSGVAYTIINRKR